MPPKPTFAVFLLPLALAACAGGPARRAGSAATPPVRCEDVVAEGQGATAAAAKRIAKAGVEQQLADARGNLLALGLRRVRGTSYETRCRPHTLGLGLVTCTAVARVCGR